MRSEAPKGTGKELTQELAELRPHSSAAHVCTFVDLLMLYEASDGVPASSYGKRETEGDVSPST